MSDKVMYWSCIIINK